MEAMKRLSNLLWFASALLAISIWTRTAMAAPVQLNIKVIYAHSKSKLIDPKLKDLAKQFSKLKFTAYELKDEGSYGQLPPRHRCEWQPAASGRRMDEGHRQRDDP